MITWQDDHLTLYGGDCRAVLAELPAESVHCVVTSPPYWGLRDYGHGEQLGLEPTPEAYVENMVAVFREVRRVLRADGTLWLNLGDSYAANRSYQVTDNKHIDVGNTKAATVPEGLKPKDLVGIPWRVAFALQADGWYLRSDIIWSKPNPMPESVTDRPTKAHEYLFLLAKSPRYYFDADAVREASTLHPADWNGDGTQKRASFQRGEGGGKNTEPGKEPFRTITAARNLRSVWTIATEPYPGAHFATFPRKLVEPCIKAGTSERGVCPECGAPWVREVERGPSHYEELGKANGVDFGRNDSQPGNMGNTRTANGTVPSLRAASSTTTGWAPSCAHGGEPVPAAVLDPFAGSGTTLFVAQALGRRGVGIDLNPDYLKQALVRNAQTPLGLIG